MVNLPNGTQVKVTHKGKLRIAKDLVLNDVLLVSHFKFNLLSIKRLCEQLHSTVQFTETLCLLQAPSQKRPLAIGKDHKGLYILDRKAVEKAAFEKKTGRFDHVAVGSCSKQFNACNHVTSQNQFHVWHQRLGHMSYNKMRTVLDVDLTHKGMKNFICEVYPKAKQHRLPFLVSNTTVASVFELIHVDTWGPYHTKTHSGQKYFLTIVDDHSRATWTLSLIHI